jgi:hypothetical protein
MEKRSMKHYAGSDVSVEEASVCKVDEAGEIVREFKVPSHLKDLADALKDPAWRLDRIGLRRSRRYWNSFIELMRVCTTPNTSGMPTKPHASTSCNVVVC